MIYDDHQLTSNLKSNETPDLLKAYKLRQKYGLYMLVLLASPRWRWCPGEYLLVSYVFRFCIKPANIRQDTSAIWEKLSPWKAQSEAVGRKD